MTSPIQLGKPLLQDESNPKINDQTGSTDKTKFDEFKELISFSLFSMIISHAKTRTATQPALFTIFC